MKITTATFIKSAMQPDQFPRDGRPEFAFVGRSNVGKSSLLNALLNRRGLAKTSATPGKTQTINFFDINNRIYLVDLPGYGYAKAPKATKHTWGRLLTDYLANRPPLRLVVQLIDARHEPSEKDHEMLQFLEETHLPTLIVATKVDKLNRSERASCIQNIRNAIDLEPDSLIIPFSAPTREGVGPIWNVITGLL